MKNTGRFQRFEVARATIEADAIIYLPKFKTHGMTILIRCEEARDHPHPGRVAFRGTGRYFRLPSREHLERRMPELAWRTLKDALPTRPVIDNHSCIRCGICQSLCPQKAIAAIGHKLVINYRSCIRCFC